MRSPRSFPATLRLFLVIVVALGCALLLTEYVCAHTLRLDRPPYNRMTLSAAEDYADWTMFPFRFAHFHAPSFFSRQWGSDFLYPAPISLLYRGLYFFSWDANWFLGLCCFLLACLAVSLADRLRRHGLSAWSALGFVGVSLLFSYPAFFVLNRGNVEIFLWIVTGAGVFFVLREKPYLAATLIGIAGACKVYPFLFLGLFLLRRKYRAILLSLVVGAALNAGSFWVEAGSFAAGRTGTAAGLEEFRQVYVLHRRYLEIGLDHSIFGLLKRCMTHVPPPEQLAHLLTWYLVAAAVAGTGLFFWRARVLPLTNQVLFLTIACIVLPPVSYDYTLLHLYTPWALLVLLAVETAREGLPTPPGLVAAFVCLAVLLAPENEFIFRGEQLGGQIKCLTLLALAAITLRYPFERPQLRVAASA